MAILSRALKSVIPQIETSPIRSIASKTISTVSTASFASVLKQTFSKTVQTTPTLTTRAVTPNAGSVTASQKADKQIYVPKLIQGKNECGPTSLAMVMKYYGVDPGDYHNMFPSDTIGHSPLALREKAIDKGMLVRQKNDASLTDLAAMIDKGIPVMTLGVYGGSAGSNASLSNYIDNASRAHWMVVTGYKKDDYGKITHVYFNDPNSSTTQCWTASDFQTKFWNANIIPGGKNYMLAMAKPGTFQESLLKSYLPKDSIPDSFRLILQTVYNLEKSFYTTESAVKDAGSAVSSAAQDVWGAATNAAEDAGDAIASAAEDAWDTVSGWLS